jgi:hypothetical protein
MKKIHKKLLSDLNKIATHFKLKLSKIDSVKNTAFAIDNSKRKFLFIDGNELPYFKTIDLDNVETCTLKIDYGRIDAGDLEIRTIDNSIVKVELQISHDNPSKSIVIAFYNINEDNVSELQPLIDKATNWRDTIAAKLPVRVAVRA